MRFFFFNMDVLRVRSEPCYSEDLSRRYWRCTKRTRIPSDNRIIKTKKWKKQRISITEYFNFNFILKYSHENNSKKTIRLHERNIFVFLTNEKHVSFIVENETVETVWKEREVSFATPGRSESFPFAISARSGIVVSYRLIVNKIFCKTVMLSVALFCIVFTKVDLRSTLKIARSRSYQFELI